jgi:hypothetical protein|tara:strand:- start:21764 stop:22033 length:270 start_codon:yes stop_codon:yes gene_type:complete
MKTFPLSDKEIQVKPATLGQLAGLEEHTSLSVDGQNKPIGTVLKVLTVIIETIPQNEGVTVDWLKGLSMSEMTSMNEIVTYFLGVDSQE